jgi:hypothetical protein
MVKYLKLALLPTLWLGLAAPALAQTTVLRADRALALSEASQTIQRQFTCVAEGVNADTDPVRAARAARCLRDEFAADAVLRLGAVETRGNAQIAATFTGAGLGAQQFDGTHFAVHTIVDRGYTPRDGLRNPTIALRVLVVGTLRNRANTPAVSLPPGSFITSFNEEFQLEEVVPGRWVIKRVDAVLISAVPIPENAITQPFPVIPSVPRS